MIDFSKLDKVAEYRDGELQWLDGRDINAIYAIRVGDEYYIGSSQYVYLRIGQHLRALLSNSHHSSKLQEKFRAVHDFDVFVLERGIDNKKLLHTEEYYIRKYKPTLNTIIPPESKYNRIKDIIAEKGLTAKELSAEIGLSSVSLYNIINGKQEASANTLNAIANALNVPFWELFVDPNSIHRNELTALVEFKGELHKAHSITELEQLVEQLKK